MNEIEQLIQLKYLTKVTGILHEAQVYQLKMWSLMLTHATSADIVFDYEGSMLIFNLLKVEDKSLKNFHSGFQKLVECTQFLLGEEYTVVVKNNGKQIFRADGVNNEDRFNKLRDSTEFS